MRLNDICTPDVVYCQPRISVLDAARIMRERHVGDLVVLEDGEDGEQIPLGMLTDRDIVVEVLAQARDAATVAVREIMRQPAIIARADEEVSEAIERMRAHGVRRLPVLGSNRRLAGILSLDDLLRQLALAANELVEITTRQQDREQRLRR